MTFRLIQNYESQSCDLCQHTVHPENRPTMAKITVSKTKYFFKKYKLLHTYNWNVILNGSTHGSFHVIRVQIAVPTQVKSKTPVWWQVRCANCLNSKYVIRILQSRNNGKMGRHVWRRKRYSLSQTTTTTTNFLLFYKIILRSCNFGEVWSNIYHWILLHDFFQWRTHENVEIENTSNSSVG